jgi:hypothetical protein
MTDGYLIRAVPRSDEADQRRPAWREYWYANIADKTAALTAVLLATLALGASVEIVSYITGDTFDWLGIPLGAIKRDGP